MKNSGNLEVEVGGKVLTVAFQNLTGKRLDFRPVAVLDMSRSMLYLARSRLRCLTATPPACAPTPMAMGLNGKTLIHAHARYMTSHRGAAGG